MSHSWCIKVLEQLYLGGVGSVQHLKDHLRTFKGGWNSH